MNWQPIETALKDGTVVWLKNDQMEDPVKGRYGDYYPGAGTPPKVTWVTVYTDHRFFPVPSGRLVCPTHWAPLSESSE